MDNDTARAMRALQGELDKLKDVVQLNGVVVGLCLVLIRSARRQGSLAADEEAAIERTLDDYAAIVEGEPTGLAKKNIELIRQVWDASKPA